MAAHPPWSMATSTITAPCFMRLQAVAGNDHRGAAAGGVEGADHQIGAAEFLLQGVIVEDAGVHRAVELAVDLRAAVHCRG